MLADIIDIALQPTIQVAAIVTAGTLMTVMINNRSRRKDNAIAVEARRKDKQEEATTRLREKQEDWARQDMVAEKVQGAAEQARKAANLLVESNEQVASVQKTTAESTFKQLGDIQSQNHQIHTLVNSALSAEMEGRLDATRDTLVLMVELVDVKRKQGHEPTTEALEAITDKKGKVATLELMIADRAKQTKIAEEQLAVAKKKNDQRDNCP